MYFSVIFLVKLLLVPTLIALVTLAGRKWGPGVAGWLSAFPIIAGPILFFIAHEQGTEFAISAATGTLSAVMAVIAFSLAYAWAATKFNWAGSLVIAVFFYAIAVLTLTSIAPSLITAFVLNIAAIVIAPGLFPVVPERTISRKAGRFDLMLCMLLSAGLVSLITCFAQLFGPRLAGMLVMFPILTGSLSVFSHRSVGREFTIQFLKGSTVGWRGFILFCFTLAILLQHTSINYAFLIAVLVAFGVQIISRRTLLQTRPPYDPEKST